MKEETLLIFKHINSKIEEVKEKYNIDNDTCFVIPIGNCADYGYISHGMIKDILQTQQRIEKAKSKIKELYELGEEWHWDTYEIKDYVDEIDELLGEKNEL